MISGKKGISEVITAVLMVVLVVAAIAILATVIISFVRDNTQNLSQNTNCITNSFSLTIESASVNQSTSSKVLTTKIKRVSGDVNISSLSFFLNGQKTTFSPTTVPQVGETTPYNTTLSDANVVGKNLDVAAVIGTQTCPASDTQAITNATA